MDTKEAPEQATTGATQFPPSKPRPATPEQEVPLPDFTPAQVKQLRRVLGIEDLEARLKKKIAFL